jgi:hypothetical protein
VILAVEPGRATVAPLEPRHRAYDIEVDAHVFMSGALPVRSLLDGGPYPCPVRVVGDANGPRLLEAAVFEGNHAVRSLEPGVPVRWPGVRFGQSGSAI